MKSKPKEQPQPRRGVTPRSENQRVYLDAIAGFDLVFGVGPAGTGKTYLAVWAAIQALQSKRVGRIVLARPAVEAGEKLGFLPGDMQEKVDPYMRPLYDALYDLMDHNRVDELVDAGVIEVAPLAFMRGRTLSNAFVILDEAQNTTPEQMKMFLTRLGPGSKCVVNGDVTQIDLPDDRDSGLLEALEVLMSVDGIIAIGFGQQDIVRHPLVQRIVDAYGRYEETGEPVSDVRGDWGEGGADRPGWWRCRGCGEEYAEGTECDLCTTG
jgi:phosphate starvation-inducible PhoH-like protein